MGRKATHHNRIANYCRTEPSFTVPFAAWELGLSKQIVLTAVNRLNAENKLVEVEPKKGSYAAVYRWRTKSERQRGLRLVTRSLTTPERELEDREVVYTTQAPAERKR